jgi:hypothetical protein
VDLGTPRCGVEVVSLTWGEFSRVGFAETAGEHSRTRRLGPSRREGRLKRPYEAGIGRGRHCHRRIATLRSGGSGVWQFGNTPRAGRRSNRPLRQKVVIPRDPNLEAERSEDGKGLRANKRQHKARYRTRFKEKRLISTKKRAPSQPASNHSPEVVKRRECRLLASGFCFLPPVSSGICFHEAWIVLPRHAQQRICIAYRDVRASAKACAALTEDGIRRGSV